MIALVEELTLQEIISANGALFNEVNPTMRLEGDSDYYMPLIQAWSEAELRLRVETNHNFNQFIWMNAVGTGLDNVAAMFGITRLPGSKPYATFTFTLVLAKDVDIHVPALILGGNGMNARVEGFTLLAKSTTIDVVAVLDSFVESSPVKTETLLTSLPYVASVTQKTSFGNGASVESDTALRERIKLSFAEFSTAGPAKAYEKLTLEADSRIRDVRVRRVVNSVEITVATTYYDTMLQSRVLAALNAETKRPLTDNIIVQEAVKVGVIINAKMTLKANIVQADVQARIENRFGSTLFKIGESLSIARMIEMLFVEGVVDVALTTPTASVNIGETNVIHIVSLGLTYV